LYIYTNFCAEADVCIEPKKAERLDVAALLKKVEQRTKQIPTFKYVYLNYQAMILFKPLY